MATILNTKNRLSSAKSTQKVVKAMELVASSKIKRAREKAQNVDFYFQTTKDMMKTLYSYNQVSSFMDLQDNEDNTLYFAITSDMGLCGAYNGNITSKLISELEANPNSKVVVVGSKGVAKLNFVDTNIDKEITDYNSLDEYEMAKDITSFIFEQVKAKKVNKVKIIYTRFVNALVQEVDMIDLFEAQEVKQEEDGYVKPNLLVEPGEEEVFKELLNQYILGIVYSSLLQSFASEHSYRRNSMENANTNSLELIDKLNLELNRIRQAMITQEISEIIGGSEALKG